MRALRQLRQMGTIHKASQGLLTKPKNYTKRGKTYTRWGTYTEQDFYTQYSQDTDTQTGTHQIQETNENS